MGFVGATSDGRRVLALFRWGDLFEEARRTARTMDPRGHFGISVRLAAPGHSIQEEEPSGVEARASARWATSLPYGLGLSVGVALESPEAYFAPQRRRERLLGAAVLGAVGLSAIAAGATWLMLVRQHRLGVQKSNFVASVSHELRAPLASVRVLADNLEQDRVADPGRRGMTLRLIGRECRRLGVLVDNVLDLSRMERGKKAIDPGPTDVTALVRETVRVASMGGEDRGVRLEVDVKAGAENLVANVDGSALQQVLANLLDNALKHAPGGSTVGVVLGVEEDRERFTLTVTDSGPGIPVGERQRVFEPFHRLGSEVRREHAGIGIGLAIVRHLVEAHGGRVWVESGTPTGARFVISMRVGLRSEAGESAKGTRERLST